jgi:hypothetical protein
MTNYDSWLAQQVEDYMQECEPSVIRVHHEPSDGEIASEPIFNCYDCDNCDCEHWQDFH